MAEPAKTLLSIENLRVSYDTPKGLIEAVRGVTFEIGRERVGIVGESGSGKSQTGKAILGLTAAGGRVTADRLAFDGIDLLTASRGQMRQVRGRRISMIMQDPKYSLNPVMTVGEQIAETCRAHSGASRRQARERALEMLRQVRIREPEKVYGLYPNQVSGGMGQRIMITMMLIADPQLIIADEPTSALDVTVQLQVLALLDDLVRERGMGLIFISHDLDLIASFCDRILVMFGGRIVDRVESNKLESARHPYTQGLLGCRPKLDRRVDMLPVLKRDPGW